MKKLLLAVVVAFMSLTAINAQVLSSTAWTKTFTTVENASDATSGVMAIDNNGNLYVSGALTTTATFGSFELEPIGLASYIVKYDAAGNVVWATAIQGAATVTAMDADAAGNLYVAGSFTDMIYVCNAGAQTYQELTGSADQTSAFVVKYNANGTVASAQEIMPTTNQDVLDSWGYYDTPYFRINKVVAANNKVYVSAIYVGDVNICSSLSLKGKYNFVWGFMYADLPSAVVFSLDANEMDSPTLVANMSSKEDFTTDMQYAVTTVNFAVVGSDVYVAFQGYGEFVCETLDKTKEVSFFVDGYGTNEHGALVAKVGATSQFCSYNNISTDITSDSYDKISAMNVVGGNLYIVGTFRGYCPFDNTLSTVNNGEEVSTSNIYVASFKTSDLSSNWVVATPDKNDVVNQQYENVVGAMIYPNEVRIVANVKKISDYSVVSASNTVVSFDGAVSTLAEEQATAIAYKGDKAASVLNNGTTSTLKYGKINVSKEETEEEIMVINGEILKTNMWNSSISAVEQAGDAVVSSPSAIDAEGNLYVTGTMNQDFDFAGNTIPNLGIGAYVAKYDIQGNEKYAFAIYGAVDITAIAAGPEGDLYVAGSFTDEVYVTDVEGVEGEYEVITGEYGDYFVEKPSAFLARYDANGNLLSVKTYNASHSYGFSAEEFWGDIPYVTIDKIVAVGEQVYVQFITNGDITVGDLTFEAKYFVYFYTAYMDSKYSAIVMFDEELGYTEKIAEVGLAYDDNFVTSKYEAVDFTVDKEVVYIAAMGYGDLAVSSSVETKEASFMVDDFEGLTEHGAFVAKVEDGSVELAKFSNISNSAWASFYSISGIDVYAGKMFIAGTFNETLAFDNAKAAIGASDVYVVTLDAATLEKEWVKTDAIDEGATNTYYEEATGMVLYKGNVYVVANVVNMNTELVTETLNYNVSANGNMSTGIVRYATAMAYSDDYAVLVNVDGTNTNISFFSYEWISGVEEAVVSETSNITYINGVYFFAEPVNAEIYDVQGRCVKAAKAATEIATAGLNKGVYILKAGNEVVKFVK